MAEYLKTVVSAVLAVGIISVILPKDSFGKYVNLLAGILVMSVIISPVLNIGDGEIKFKNLDIETLNFDVNSYIMEEYEKELAENVKDMLKEKTNIDFSVLVHADKKDDIIEIKEVKISPFTTEYVSVVSGYLGVDERRITQK